MLEIDAVRNITCKDCGKISYYDINEYAFHMTDPETKIDKYNCPKCGVYDEATGEL